MPISAHDRAYYFLVALITLFAILTILLVSGLSYGLYRRLAAWSHGKKNLAAFIALFVVILIIIVPLIFVATLLLSDAINLFFVAQSKIILLNSEGGGILQKLSSRYEIDLNLIFNEQVLPWLKSVGF